MTSSLFRSPSAEADIPAGSTMPAQQGVSRGDFPRQSVGPRLHSMTHREIEERLDAAIREMGDKSDEAMRQGDPTGARIWAERMTVAIKSRSPDHKARLHDELERRLNEGADYFAWQGRLDAELAAKGKV